MNEQGRRGASALQATARTQLDRLEGATLGRDRGRLCRSRARSELSGAARRHLQTQTVAGTIGFATEFGRVVSRYLAGALLRHPRLAQADENPVLILRSPKKRSVARGPQIVLRQQLQNPVLGFAGFGKAARQTQRCG